MNLESDDPTQGLSEFFETIWRDATGFVYLPTINRDTNKWRKVFFQWPDHKEPIVQHVLASSAQGLDVYYAPAIFNEPASPTKENFKGSYTLWTEFDGTAPENWEGEGHTESPDSSEAGSVAPRDENGHLPPPSLRVQSSKDGHEHVYWRLDEFVTDAQWIEDKNRAITYEHGADSSGWDCTQILRPPFTTNFKHDLPVTVRQSTESILGTEKFAFLRPPAQLVNESIDVENLPSVEKVVAKYTWDDTHFDLFMNDAPTDRSGALMKLGFFGAEKGMTDGEIYALLLHADDRWKKYVHRQDRKRRLTDIINRARQKHPRALTETTFAGLLGTATTKVEQGLPITFGFADFLASDVKVEWAIEGLVEVGGMGMVAAMPGVGKTQVSIQLGACCALGIPFLKWNTLRQQKVVLFSLEMSHVALKFFMEDIAKQYTPEQAAILNENLIVVPLGEVIHLDRKEGMEFVFSLLDQIQPDAVIFDSIGKVTMEELNEKNARLLNVQFKAIRDRYNCFLWFIHHNRKASENNKKPVSLGDVYGNQYLTADMTSILILWSDFKTDDEVEVIPVKMRLSKMTRPFKTHRNENLHFSVKADSENVEMMANLGNKSQEGRNQRSDDGDGLPRTFGNI